MGIGRVPEAGRALLKRPRAGLQHVSALLGFAVLTVLMTWPLVLRVADSVPGWPGDNLHYVRLLWWFKRAIIDLRIRPSFDPLVYTPEGLDLSHMEMTWANTLLALPLTALAGPVVAYNVCVLLSFVLTGFAVHLWIWRATGSSAAGFAAGVIFTFSPYRMAHYAGHLPLMPTQWLAFALYAIEELARTRRLGFAFLAGLAFGLNAWASWYYFAFSLVVVPLYIWFRWRGWRVRVRWRALWLSAAVFAVVALAMVIPAVWPYLRFRGEGRMVHPFDQVDAWSANPTDFLQPNLAHPLWRDALRSLVPFPWEQRVERNLYLGVAPLLLALVAVIARWRARVVRALGWLAAAALVLALGPTLHWAGRRVYVTIPTGVMAILYHLGVTPYLAIRLDPVLLEDMQRNHFVFVPLPMLMAYLFVPFAASMRVVARFGGIAMLAVAGLAGRGLAFLRSCCASRAGRQALLLSVVLIVLLEFVALPHEMTELTPRPVDLWLAGQPPSVVVELPVAEGTHPLQDYYATVHQQAMVFGPSAVTFVPPTMPERWARLRPFPDQASFEALREYEALTLIVHTDAYADWPRQIAPWEATGQLRLNRCFDEVCVYELLGSS